MVDESDNALLERHAFVLFDMDVGQCLTGVNAPEGEPAPRLFLARGRSSARVWFRSDVSAGLASACRRLTEDLPGWDGQEPESAIYDPLRAALSKKAPITSEYAGPAFRFGGRAAMDREEVAPRLIDEPSADLLDRYFPWTRRELGARSPVVGVVIDGSVVSACYSARRRATACEAGVATEEAYRGRGLGALVVAAWRDAVEKEGRQPLYSTSWDNLASRALARKLRLIPYADTLSLT